MKCAWCDERSTTTIEIEPAVYDKKTHEVLKFAIRAPVCEAHRVRRALQPAKPFGYPLRRKAKGVQQMSIFDVPGIEPDNAIFGGDK